MKKLNVKPLVPMLGLALLSLVPVSALALPALPSVLLASAALKGEQDVLDNLTGENLTQAMQRNQNTATVLQWDDLLGLLRPVAPGLTLKAAGSQVLGMDNGNRVSYLGGLNAGFMHAGVRIQLGLHYHSTFFHDALSNGIAPKESTHMTGYNFTVGAAVPVSGLLLSVQFSYLTASGHIRGVDAVYSSGSQVFYNLGRLDLDQVNTRLNVAMSKNFALSFSQVLTPYLAYQLERNQMGAVDTRIYNTTGIFPVKLHFDEQIVSKHSAMAGLMYQVSDAFATQGLALGLDYTIAYRFGSKPKYNYTATLDPANTGDPLVYQKGTFKNPDSGVMQRFGLQLGYQWGAVYVGSDFNMYYTLTPDNQPGILNTQYSLQLSGSF